MDAQILLGALLGMPFGAACILAGMRFAHLERYRRSKGIPNRIFTRKEGKLYFNFFLVWGVIYLKEFPRVALSF